MAELDRNVTTFERSQQNVSSREETYNQPWQTVGLNAVRRRVCGIQHPRYVTDTLIEREKTKRDLTEHVCEDKNDQTLRTRYVLGYRDCHGCLEHSSIRAQTLYRYIFDPDSIDLQGADIHVP